MEHETKNILFAWDFHGVLEKDNEYAVLEVTNRVLKNYKVKRQMTLEECRLWCGLSWYDYFKNLYPKQKDKIYTAMVEKACEIQTKENISGKYIKPMDEALETLDKIKGFHHSNIVISNSNPKIVKYFTDLVGLTSYFDDLLGADKHHLRTYKAHLKKSSLLTEFLQNHQFNKVVMIGDTADDILADKSIGAITYLFTGSRCFTDHDLIDEIKPDYVIEKLSNVLDELRT
ncbi:MAG: HAD hydrolase-like protein [Candidatus Jacksonbacteria bacterium]